MKFNKNLFKSLVTVSILTVSLGSMNIVSYAEAKTTNSDNSKSSFQIWNPLSWFGRSRKKSDNKGNENEKKSDDSNNSVDTSVNDSNMQNSDANAVKSNKQDDSISQSIDNSGRMISFNNAKDDNTKNNNVNTNDSIRNDSVNKDSNSKDKDKVDFDVDKWMKENNGITDNKNDGVASVKEYSPVFKSIVGSFETIAKEINLNLDDVKANKNEEERTFVEKLLKLKKVSSYLENYPNKYLTPRLDDAIMEDSSKLYYEAMKLYEKKNVKSSIANYIKILDNVGDLADLKLKPNNTAYSRKFK